MTEMSTIAFRTATEADDRVLRELSALDSAVRPLARPAALAVLDGRPVAAVSLENGRVVADPFVRTDGAVALLKARVASLAADHEPARRPVVHLPRLRAAA